MEGAHYSHPAKEEDDLAASSPDNPSKGMRKP